MASSTNTKNNKEG